MEYDLLIAGSGPAGLAAAIRAGQLGLTCAVLEKKSEGDYKACGDGLTIRAINALERLGITRNDLLVKGAREITGSIHYFSNNTVRLTHKPGSMYTLRRLDLLAMLREKARSYGVSLIFDFHGKIKIKDAGVTAGMFHADALIDATGAAPKNGAPDDLPLGMSGLIQGWQAKISECETHIIHCLDERYGYCWAFPLANHAWNVGIWRTENLQSLKADFNAFVNGWLKKQFGSFCWINLPSGAYLGTERKLAVQRDYVMFCGDAAGACSILNGEGISSAIDSGICACEALAARLDLCPHDAVEEAFLFQRACPETILAVLPIYSGMSGSSKYRFRTCVGDYYGRYDSCDELIRINALRDIVSVPGVKVPDWYAVNHDRRTTVSGYAWVDGQSLESAGDLDTVMNAAPQVAQLLRCLHNADVSRYVHYRFDFEADYRFNRDYLKAHHIEFPHFSEICCFIEGNLYLLHCRPIALTHQDVRLCNILIDQADHIYLIDIMGACIADPWSDFSKILVMSDQKTNAFADALVRCYFDNHVPNEFSVVTALYISFYLMQYAVSKHRKKGSYVRTQAERVFSYLTTHSCIRACSHN